MRGDRRWLLAIAGALLRLGAVAVLLVIVILIVLPVASALAVSTSLFNTPVGPETPPGRRWLVANLAQRPGTELSALLLTRALVRSVPSGSVLVAAAASEKLAKQYAGIGFTRGGARRVFKIR